MTAHQIAGRTIPQMRKPSHDGAGSLSVGVDVADGIAVITVRGSASTSLDPLLAALDGVFDATVRGVILECTQVVDWSRRGMEVVVLAVTRARGRRMDFALAGLPVDQLEMLLRQRPGIGSDGFTYPDLVAARAALLARPDEVRAVR